MRGPTSLRKSISTSKSAPVLWMGARSRRPRIAVAAYPGTYDVVAGLGGGREGPTHAMIGGRSVPVRPLTSRSPVEHALNPSEYVVDLQVSSITSEGSMQLPIVPCHRAVMHVSAGVSTVDAGGAFATAVVVGIVNTRSATGSPLGAT